MRYSTHTKGFTLIELLVVISIISFISSIVFASLNTARYKARVAAGQVFSANIHSALGANAVGQWDFNTMTSNIVTDDSGNNNSGTVTGGSLSTDVPSRGGNSISLTGSGVSEVSIPNNVNYRFGAGDFAFAFWVKVNALSSSNTYFENGAWADNSILFRQNAPGTLSLYIYSILNGCGGGYQYNYSYTPTIGEWVHMAVTRDNGIMKVFINGAQLGADVAVTCGISPTQPLKIGSSVHTTGQLLNGLFDNFRIYNKSLKSADVKELYVLGH
jgi:arabinan endo-1,5-alpha-L-arabinosidase